MKKLGFVVLLTVPCAVLADNCNQELAAQKARTAAVAIASLNSNRSDLQVISESLIKETAESFSLDVRVRTPGQLGASHFEVLISKFGSRCFIESVLRGPVEE